MIKNKKSLGSGDRSAGRVPIPTLREIKVMIPKTILVGIAVMLFVAGCEGTLDEEKAEVLETESAVA